MPLIHMVLVHSYIHSKTTQNLIGVHSHSQEILQIDLQFQVKSLDCLVLISSTEMVLAFHQLRLGRDVWANNVVIAWTNLSNVSLYMDNTKYNSGVAPNLIFTTVDIGSAGGLSWFWCIKNVRIWKTRPTDAGLLNLSNTTFNFFSMDR